MIGLERVRHDTAIYMERILELFQHGSRITVMVRQPGFPDQDFLLTNDTLDEAIELLKRSKTRAAT